MHRRDFEAEMAKLDKELEEFERWEAAHPTAGGWAYGKLVGATVNSVYTGMETILEAVLKRTDPPLEQNQGYHARLIKAAANATETRDALISEALRALLDDLRGFRHVGRKRYGSDIDPDRAKLVLQNAQEAAPRFRREMAQAIAALEEAQAIADAERLEPRKTDSHTKKRSG